MTFIVFDRKIKLGWKQISLLLGLFFGLIALETSGFSFRQAVILLGVVYLVLGFATQPLSRVIARLGFSIRWKFEFAIAIIAALFFIVTLIQVRAMDFMHHELHDIQELGLERPDEVLRAVNDLEDTHHGSLFKTIPVFGVLGVLGATALGAALALSVINPVGRMGQAMRRIASGDFSQPLRVDNRDEMGALAGQINVTAEELKRLQEATLADERARALRERNTQVKLAEEEERRRISRELHDGLGPSLAAIGNRLRACRYLVRSDPERAEVEIEETTQNLKGHVQEIRKLIYNLRPLALDQLGLAGALKQCVERFGQDIGLQASFSVSGEAALHPFTEVTVFRVVQECLTNVQKHADASQVDVTLVGSVRF